MKSLVSALAAAAFLLGGCSQVEELTGGGEETTDHIETTVEEGLVKQVGDLGFTPEVICPDTVDQKSGDTFRCLIEDVDDPGVTVDAATITVQNDAGDFIWEVAG